MEIADIFVVNKADREGADRTVASIEAMLSLESYGADRWRPPIVKTEATTGRGIAELWNTVKAFRTHSEGTRVKRLKARNEFRLRDLLTHRFMLLTFTAVGVAILVAASQTLSWDASESRRNSFPESAVDALRSIGGVLHVEAHFAPEDPRRSDLEHNAFRKLRRALPRARIDYVSATSTGLFEQTSEKYGEIWYQLGGKTQVSRITTAEGVLENVLSLAGIAAPAESDDDVFRGHPLAARPRGAALLFYGLWPLIVASMAFIQWRK